MNYSKILILVRFLNKSANLKKATALDRSSSCTEALQRTVPIAFLRLNEQDNLQAGAEKLLQFDVGV